MARQHLVLVPVPVLGPALHRGVPSSSTATSKTDMGTTSTTMEAMAQTTAASIKTRTMPEARRQTKATRNKTTTVVVDLDLVALGPMAREEEEDGRPRWGEAVP